MQTNGTQDLPEGAASGVASAHGLPEWLVSLVDPAVMAARARMIEKRLASEGDDAALRYECARVMADYFEKVIND